jgi:hypothetical protein
VFTTESGEITAIGHLDHHLPQISVALCSFRQIVVPDGNLDQGDTQTRCGAIFAQLAMSATI